MRGAFTAADLADLGPLPCNVPVASLRPMIVPPRRALATGRARHVGDPVAFVVAETRDAARNAAEAIVVDYDELPAIVDAPAALAPGAPQLWNQAPGNLCVPLPEGRRGRRAGGDAGAAHVVELELVNNRIVICALEPRGAIGAYDDAHGFHLTILRRRRARAEIATGRQRVPRASRARCAFCAPDAAGASA